MRRVLFVINSPSGGGAERAIGLAAQELKNSDITVRVLAINASAPDPNLAQIKIDCLERNWNSGIIEFFLTLLKFWKYLRVHKPDVVVLNCDLPEFCMALTPYKGKILLVEHSSMPWHTRILLGRVIRKFLANRLNAVITVSKHLSPWSLNDTHTYHIPNAILPIRAAPKHNGVCKEIRRLVFVGRLVEFQKQPNWLVKISLRTGLPILFIGDGEYRLRLTKICSEAGVQCEFAGFVNDPWSRFLAGDLLIVPSRFEGSPLSVLEAIANQVPMLLNDVPDLRQFELEPKHFASGQSEMSETVWNHRADLQYFLPKQVDLSQIISNHSPSNVAIAWHSLLSKI